MTQHRSIEERISSWLVDEAPRELPDRVLRSTFERTRALRQRRALWSRRSLPGLCSYFVLIAGAVVVVLAIVGVGIQRQSQPSGFGGQPSPSSAPSLHAKPSTSPSPVSKTFVSPSGYSITATTDWSLATRSGTWDGFTDGPIDADAGTDLYTNPTADQWIKIGGLPIAPGTTLSRWVEDETPRAVLTGCTFAPPETSVVGGRSVQVSRGPCGSIVVTNVYLVGGSRGVLVQWGVFPGDEAAAKPTFLQILGSIQFR